METRTALVVEDDDAISQLVRQLLEDEGLSVERARDGAEAIEKIASARRSPALMVLDLRLPRLEGEAVALEVQRTRPEIPILLLSGISSHELARVARRVRASSWLAKPFEIDDFGAAVKDALRRTPRRHAGPPTPRRQGPVGPDYAPVWMSR